MEANVKNVLKGMKKSLTRYGKLDNWNLSEKISILEEYVNENADSERLTRYVSKVCRCAKRPVLNTERMIRRIDRILRLAEPATMQPVSMTAKRGHRIKKAGQSRRFKGETHRIFEEKLRFMDGMMLRNFDIETENASDSRKVRRIVEKRMCQAYHRVNKNSRQEKEGTNSDRYWMKRATSFQLYNIGQVEHVKYVSRGQSTHWKRVYDPETGGIVMKKKMAYPTKEAAMEAVRNWHQDHPEDHRKINAYRCAVCGKWHIGHPSSFVELEINSQKSIQTTAETATVAETIQTAMAI